jgi:hypothetical protein
VADRDGMLASDMDSGVIESGKRMDELLAKMKAGAAVK